MTAPLDPSELAALAEKATKGPWQEGSIPWMVWCEGGRVGICKIIEGGTGHDRSLIVYLRNNCDAILALAAEVEGLRAVAKAAREYRKRERTGGACDIETTARLAEKVDAARDALDRALDALGKEES